MKESVKEEVVVRLNCDASSVGSGKHQFSPDNIHMLLREMIMRGNKMITKEKMKNLYVDIGA